MLLLEALATHGASIEAPANSCWLKRPPRMATSVQGGSVQQPGWLERIKRFRTEGAAICPPCHTSYIIEEVLYPYAVERHGDAKAREILDCLWISTKERAVPADTCSIPCNRDTALPPALAAKGFFSPPGMRGSPLANHSKQNMQGRARVCLEEHMGREALHRCLGVVLEAAEAGQARGHAVALQCYCWDMFSAHVTCSKCRKAVPLGAVGEHRCAAPRPIHEALDFPLTFQGQQVGGAEVTAWTHSSRYGGYTIRNLQRFAPRGSFMVGTPRFPDMVTVIKGALPQELERQLNAWIEADAAATAAVEKYRKFTMPGALPTRFYQQVGNQQAERQTPQVNWTAWDAVPQVWKQLFLWVGRRFPLAQRDTFSSASPDLIWDQSSYNLYYKVSGRTGAKLKGEGLAVHADVECCRVGTTDAKQVYVYERVPQILIAGGTEGRWTIVLRDSPDPQSGVLLSSFANSAYRRIRAGDSACWAKVQQKGVDEGRSTTGKVRIHFPAEMLTQAVLEADDQTGRVGHSTTLNFIFGGGGNRNPLARDKKVAAAMVATELQAGAVTILNSSHTGEDGLPIAFSSANTIAVHEVEVDPIRKRKGEHA